jgi:hypothetical protein
VAVDLCMGGTRSTNRTYTRTRANCTRRGIIGVRVVVGAGVGIASGSRGECSDGHTCLSDNSIRVVGEGHVAPGRMSGR